MRRRLACRAGAALLVGLALARRRSSLTPACTFVHLQVNSDDNSHLVTVPPGPHVLSDILLSSPIVQGEDGGAAAAMATGGGGGGGDGGFAEFGVDPALDPEFAWALRVSMEEERQRQENEAKAKAEAEGGGEGAGSAEAAAGTEGASAAVEGTATEGATTSADGAAEPMKTDGAQSGGGEGGGTAAQGRMAAHSRRAPFPWPIRLPGKRWREEALAVTLALALVPNLMRALAFALPLPPSRPHPRSPSPSRRRDGRGGTPRGSDRHVAA